VSIRLMAAQPDCRRKSGKLVNSRYNVFLRSRLLGGFFMSARFPFVLIIRGALKKIAELSLAGRLGH